MNWKVVIALCAAFIIWPSGWAATQAARAAVPSTAQSAQVQTLRVPDGGVYPQVAVDQHHVLHLIYCKGDAKACDIFYVTSRDDGRTFSKPMRVNSQPGSAIVIGTVRGPQLALGENDRPHVAWMGSNSATPRVGDQNPMLYTRLNDAGDAFEPQRNLIVTNPGLDGGGSVAADEDGNVYVAWHAPQLGSTGEANRQVWLRRSTDEGKTFDDERAVAPGGVGACGCCGLKIGAAPGGIVDIVFRTAHEKVNRDILILASRDRGQTFHAVLDDPWNVGICVMSTAALLPEGGDTLAAWETHDRVFYTRLSEAMTKNSARGIAAPQPIPVPTDGKKQKHPCLAATQETTLVAWSEVGGWGQGGRVCWQLFDKTGQRIPNPSAHADGLPPWSEPASFVATDGTYRVIY